MLTAGSVTWADGIVNATVDGNRLTARIELAGDLRADLSVEFENAVGLSAANLGLSAETVDPTDLSLLLRLPDLDTTGIAAGFPVRVHIAPPTGGGLSFSGTASIELYTHNLLYTAGTPLRLFSAPDGGQFRDITEAMSSGSYRVRGSKGQFSEFLIVADLRATDTVVRAKFDRLRDLLDTHGAEMSNAAYTELDSMLAAARQHYANGQVIAAIGEIEAFARAVKARSGGDIPDVWRATRDITNVGGMLRAGAGTLRFSLTLASNNLP